MDKHLNFHATIYPASLDHFDLKAGDLLPNFATKKHLSMLENIYFKL